MTTGSATDVREGENIAGAREVRTYGILRNLVHHEQDTDDSYELLGNISPADGL